MATHTLNFPGANLNAKEVTLGETPSTSKITGALKVAGGVGIQGDLYATDANLENVEADSVNVTNNTPSTSTATGALKVTGGVGIQGDLYATDANLENVEADRVNVTDTTISATTTTGALKVAGGIGVANNVHVGNDVYIGSNLNVDTNSLHVDSVSNRVGIGKTDPGFHPRCHG